MARKKDFKAFINYFKNHSPEEIGDFLTTNNLIVKYVNDESWTAAANAVVNSTCFNDSGEFVQNTNAMNVIKTVYDFWLRTGISLDGYTYEQCFDILMEYRIMDVIYGLSDMDRFVFDKYCDNVLSDVRTNNYIKLIKQ